MGGISGGVLGHIIAPGGSKTPARSSAPALAR